MTAPLPTSPTAKEVAILGAGVTSLTIAYVLRSQGYAVTILARDLPWDLASQSFASPWAGANWCSFATTPAEERRDTATFRRWLQLLPSLPDETMALLRFTHHWPDSNPNLWFKDLVGDFQPHATPLLPHGYSADYTSFTLHVPRYLSFLVSELTSPMPHLLAPSASSPHPLGPPTTFIRTGTLASLSSAATLVPAIPLLINATGLGARHLSDLDDAAVHPIRGQTLVLRSPAFQTPYGPARCVMKPGAPALYVIPRARSGEVVLGGSFEVGVDGLEPDEALSERILRGCVEVCPELLWKDGEGRERWKGWSELSTVVESVNVGLRPGREGGARVEVGEAVARSDGSRVQVVHAYGVGPAGYQASFGIAEEVAALVDMLCERQARL